MAFTDWVSRAQQRVRDFGVVDGARISTRTLLRGMTARATWAAWPDIGSNTNMLAHDWDGLIVLDTCRPDALADVADEYDFLPETPPTRYSNASWSQQWYKRTFTQQHADRISELALITANPFSDGFDTGKFQVDVDAFADYVPVWTLESDQEFEGTPPQLVTDHTIDSMRSTDASQFVAHFMQPHAPYRSLPSTANGDTQLWSRVYSGRLSREEAWNIYLDNLRWVLDEVEVLLENVDADRVMITADHTELFGEFGMYGHPRKCHVPTLRRVPWVETTATDRQTREPSLTDESTDRDIEDQLAALGYR